MSLPLRREQSRSESVPFFFLPMRWGKAISLREEQVVPWRKSGGLPRYGKRLSLPLWEKGGGTRAQKSLPPLPWKRKEQNVFYSKERGTSILGGGK